MYTRYNDWSGTRRQVSSGKEIFSRFQELRTEPISTQVFFVLFFLRQKLSCRRRYTFLEKKTCVRGKS